MNGEERNANHARAVVSQGPIDRVAEWVQQQAVSL